jgi:hypothetical protein
MEESLKPIGPCQKGKKRDDIEVEKEGGAIYHFKIKNVGNDLGPVHRSTRPVEILTHV